MSLFALSFNLILDVHPVIIIIKSRERERERGKENPRLTDKPGTANSTIDACKPPPAFQWEETCLLLQGSHVFVSGQRYSGATVQYWGVVSLHHTL